MYPFTYYRAHDFADALSRLASDPEAKTLAGGMTLLPSMKHRLSAPSQLIDIAGLPELRSIQGGDRSLSIGAACRYADIAAHPEVAALIPALIQVAESIGDPQVRSRGTIGGSLANNDPAADFPAAVLALSAVIRTDRRDIAADDYFQGMFTTALGANELIREFRFAVPRRATYAKFHHPASGYAMTGVFVADFGETVRVAVTGAAPSVFRWHEAESALTRDFAPAAVAGLKLPPDGLNADMHAPAAYRAQLAAVMLQQAVAEIVSPDPGRPGGGMVARPAGRDRHAEPGADAWQKATAARAPAPGQPVGGSQHLPGDRRRLSLTVNGARHDVAVEDRTLLADLLRDELGLTGTHLGCDTSQCGCCTVLLDGTAVKSCTTLAVQADGADIVTIEGLATPGDLHPLQQAFSACHGLQCGYCTPGMIMAATDLLARHPDPTDEQVRDGLAGNLCRCTGYVNIEAAVRSAAATLRQRGGA